MFKPEWQTPWVAGKPSPAHQNTACWICHANQNGTWHALCSFPFQKIYFKCLPCALFWKLTFQMHQCKLREGSITNKDVAIQRVSTNIGKTGETTAAAGTSRSLHLWLLLLLLLRSLFRKTPSISPGRRSSGKLSQLTIYRLVCKQWVYCELVGLLLRLVSIKMLNGSCA